MAWLAADIFLLVTYYVLMHAKKKRDNKGRPDMGGRPLAAGA